MERDALLGVSGFADLEAFVHDLLDEEGRVRLKLQSPLGPVEELARRYRGAVEERLNLLEDDFRTSRTSRPSSRSTPRTWGGTSRRGSRR
jgi:hypothetical protein